MKKYLFANWKLHKSSEEAAAWLKEFAKESGGGPCSLGVVICPSFLLLPVLAKEIGNYQFPFSLSLGAQDVSRFPEGQFTGEVGAFQIKEFASYVVIGHSERRKYFSESKEEILAKGKQSFKAGLTPLFCLSEAKEASWLADLRGNFLVAFEPPEAISEEGKFKEVKVEEAVAAAREIKRTLGDATLVLYGGSVNLENASELASQKEFSGALVGLSSLDASTFAKLVHYFQSTAEG